MINLFGHSLNCSKRCFNSRYRTHMMDIGRFTNCFSVRSTTTTLRRVDHKGDFAARDEIDRSDFGTFTYFANNCINHVTETTEVISGTRSGHNAKSECPQSLSHNNPSRLIPISKRQKYCSACGQNSSGRKFGFIERATECHVNSHDLTSRTHFWSERSVNFGESTERQHRLFHGHRVRRIKQH